VDTNPNREPICSYCRRNLIKLQDRNNRNISWFCSFCQIETLGEETNDLRSKSKIMAPTSLDNSKNPAVAYPPEPGLKHNTVEYKGGTAVLSKKGTIRITGYVEGKG
jgi:hypothetical protein